MDFKPGETVYAGFSTQSSTGAATDADSLPTATVNRNGTDDGAVTVTVAKIDTGSYKASFVIPATYVPGDVLFLRVAATVSTIAGKASLSSQRVGIGVVSAGTLLAGSSTGGTLGLAIGADSRIVGSIIALVAGTGAGQAGIITAYTNTSKAFTVGRPWATTPDNTTVYAILPGDSVKVDSSLKAAGVVLVDTASTLTNNIPTSGTIGQTGSITGDSRISGLPLPAAGTQGGLLILGANTGSLSISAGVTFNSLLLTNGGTFNLVGGTIGTTTNLTNAPTAGDFTTAMKTSLSAATPSVTVSDKTGFSLASAYDPAKTAAQAGDAMALTTGERTTLAAAIWNALTSGMTTAGSIAKRIIDNLTGDIFARLGAPAGASHAVDIAAVKSDTGLIKTKTDLFSTIGATFLSSIGEYYNTFGYLPAVLSVQSGVQADVAFIGGNDVAILLAFLDAAPTDWITAAAIHAAALNGKGDWAKETSSGGGSNPVSGTVTNNIAVVLDGASVSAFQNGQLIGRTTTGSDGVVNPTLALNDGNYTLSVTCSGFEGQNVPLSVNGDTTFTTVALVPITITPSVIAGQCNVYDTAKGTDNVPKSGVIYRTKCIGAVSGTQNGRIQNHTSSGTSADNMLMELGRNCRFQLFRGDSSEFVEFTVPDAASAHLEDLLSKVLIGSDPSAP